MFFLLNYDTGESGSKNQTTSCCTTAKGLPATQFFHFLFFIFLFNLKMSRDPIYKSQITVQC